MEDKINKERNQILKLSKLYNNEILVFTKIDNENVIGVFFN